MKLTKDDLVFGRYKNILIKDIETQKEQVVEIIYTQPGNNLGRGKLMMKSPNGFKSLDPNLLGKEYDLFFEPNWAGLLQERKKEKTRK